MWDDRYSKPGYLFGTEPADFVRRNAARLAPASDILCVADGEGRNSVWLAEQGHKVTAFDASPVGVAKARALADARGVAVNFGEADIFDPAWTDAPRDAVFGIFIQFMPPGRRGAVFDLMVRALKPGGTLFLHGYAPRQVGYGTGGPPQAKNMYTLDQLRADFGGLVELEAKDYDAEIDEGPGHSGLSGLVDFIARRP